jgi:NAD-specific glutamate dehydrogenase
LAVKIASMDALTSTFDIAEISSSSHLNLQSISKIYFAVGGRFSLKWLGLEVSKLNYDNYWQKISARTVLDDLNFYQMRIAKMVVDYSCSKSQKSIEGEPLINWIESKSFAVQRFDDFIAELKGQTNPDLSVFIVALSRLKTLVS